MKPFAPFLLFFLIMGTSAFSQLSINQNISNELAKVKGLSKDLAALESFGVKGDGSDGLNNTLNWLESRYIQMGYTQVTRDSFNHPLSDNININLIIDKKGTDTTLGKIVICSHYDTRTGPGVNDNGTGVAATIKIAEIISGINTSASIRFIHFAGEEDGLLGSTHYVNNVLGSNGGIRMLLNLDQLGGTQDGSGNDKITCERDETSPDFNNAASWKITDTLASLINTYTSLTAVIGPAFSSDYMPFQEKGYVITGLWQFDGFQYPFYHSAGDSLVHVDTSATTEVTKGALAAVLHFSQTPGFVNSIELRRNTLGIYPNPSTGMIAFDLPVGEEYELQLTDGKGQVIGSYVRKGGKNSMDLELQPGMYFLRATDSKGGPVYAGKFVAR